MKLVKRAFQYSLDFGKDMYKLKNFIIEFNLKAYFIMLEDSVILQFLLLWNYREPGTILYRINNNDLVKFEA